MDTIALLDLDRGAITFYKTGIGTTFYKNRMETAIAFVGLALIAIAGMA
jgi:hypothetical protein